MKALNFKKILVAVFALFTAIILLSGIKGTSTVASAAYNSYSYAFHFEKYNAVYDISSNREIDICEDLTITYEGSLSTGFIKDIPVNGAELVRDIEVYELIDGEQTPVIYYVYTQQADSYDNFLCVDIGSDSIKTGETHTYRIKYKYLLTKSQEGANNIALNVIGVGREYYCDIKSANIKLILPDGFNNANFLIGTLDNYQKADFDTYTENGRNVLSLSDVALEYNEGVTVGLEFENGALSNYFDFTPYIYVLICALLIFAIFAFKMLFFNKTKIMPVVNFEAPERMDPLMMGKLIDNSIDTEDITSMIFYWADKGYLKIDLTNEKDPTLIRVYSQLPDGVSSYERQLFDGIFERGEVVTTSSLANRFYVTADNVKAQVNGRVKGLYSISSTIASHAFSVLCAIILGVAPLITAFFSVSSEYTVFAGFATIVPLFFINILAQAIITGILKFKKLTMLLMGLGILGISVIATLFYILLVPSFIFDLPSKIVLALVACAVSTISSILLSRTVSYTEKLNDIVGFKNFILLAEKNQLEMLIETNPQFYYHVLPYAQVLGVSDKWEEKFANIVIEPPYWLTNRYSLFELYLFNRMMHGTISKMNSHMYSRPSSSGSGGHGGFGGGHMGGGHGGGGFRGR